MALGKSLGNILGDYFGEENQAISTSKPVNTESENGIIQDIPTDSIRRADHQTRVNFDPDTIKQLAMSIEQNGLIHPIMVLRDADGYVLLSGERRLKAYQSLGKKMIPAIVREPAKLTKPQQAMLTAIENLQREDLSHLELAKTFDMLVKVNKIDGSKLARKLGYTPQYVNNYLRLLTGSPAVQEALLAKRITEGQARHLLQVGFELQEKLLAIIIDQQLSVVQIAKLVKQNLENKKSTPRVFTDIPDFISPKVESLCKGLPNAKVKYSGDDKVGRLIIEWKS
jgi:ParB family transcriptional regulator, chromosome partitioning protein